MSVYLLPSGTTEVLWFDVCPTGESITFPAEVTDHPIEKSKANAGQPVDSISDHTIIRPIEFTIKGFVSNTPTKRDRFLNRGLEGLFTIRIPNPVQPGPSQASINPATQQATLTQSPPVQSLITASATGLIFPPMNRVREMILALNRIRNASRLCAVVTRDLRWDNVAVGTWSVDRTSGGADFEIECRQIATVENRVVTAPLPKEPRGLFNDQKGPQEPQEGFTGQKQSLSHMLAGAVNDMLGRR